MSTAATTEGSTHPDHPDWAGPQRFAGMCAIAGLVLFAVAGLANYAAADGPGETETAKGQFFLSYLVGYVYWLSLPVGGMALLFIHYLAKTSWGILLKRPLEAATRTFPLMTLLFVPLVFGLTLGKASPYWWAAPEYLDVHEPAKDAPPPADNREKAEALSKQMIHNAVAHVQKERSEGTYGFLSMPGMIAVGAVVFLVWGTFMHFLYRWGQDAQDDPAKVEGSLERLKNVSGPGLIVYALTLTAIATQWVMSLEESWASTMFPVIFAMNQFLTCFAFCLALFLTLAARPPLKDVLRDKFQLDMGTLLLAFTLFWSYTSFSQLMLVWIGNLPEEIPFYLKRSVPTYGFWWVVSAGLIGLHFALPFLLLLFRDVKKSPRGLRTVALYLLVICAIDVTWWIEPTRAHDTPFYLAMDLGSIVGIGGLWGTFFLAALKRRPLLPTNELYTLPEGHHHESH